MGVDRFRVPGVTRGGSSVGIDLGTTFTAAAVCRAGSVEPVTLGTSGWSIPSVIHLSMTGEIVCGESAEYLGTSDPSRTIREFKRHFGSDAPFVTPDGDRAPEWCMSQLLTHVMASTSAHAAQPARTVVTHPANWGEHRRDLLSRCAADAGIGTVELLAEPVAAAVHYASLDRIAAGELIAIYDFGGGTFDATVLQHNGSTIDILGTPRGADDIGGIDLDQILVEMVDDASGGLISGADVGDPSVLVDLYALVAECRRCKISLSSDLRSPVRIRIGPTPLEALIHRHEFEHRAKPLVKRTLDVLFDAVASAGVGIDELDRVLLVGGTSRMPLVGQLVSDTTGLPISVDIDAASAIAQGAALHGSGHSLERDDLPGFVKSRVMTPTGVPDGHHFVAPGEAVGASEPSTMTLTVTASDGQTLFARPPGPYTIGRNVTCDLVLDRPVVSRVHGTLRLEPSGGWLYLDSSSNGSFVDDAAHEQLRLDRHTVIHLGQEGPELTIAPDGPGTVLSVEAGGQLIYPARDRTYVIGRRAPADLVVVDPDQYASGQHLELRHDADGWMIRDTSTNGTFFPDGRRLDGSYHRLDGNLVVRLGTPDGPPVAFVWRTDALDRSSSG